MRTLGVVVFLSALAILIALLPRMLTSLTLSAVPSSADRSAHAQKSDSRAVRPQNKLPDNLSRRFLSNWPIAFEPNRGQTALPVEYLAHNGPFALFLTRDDAILRLAGSLSSKHESKPSTAVIHLRPLRPDKHLAMRGEDPMRARVSYFRGGDSSKWHTDIPTYAKVRESRVWPGVDLLWYGNDGQLECDFVLAPGANPDSVKLALDGADSAKLDSSGDVRIVSHGREMRLLKPLVYQNVGRARHSIAGAYVLSQAKHGGYEIAFKLADYDRSRTLIVDPVISYLTFLGGSGQFQASGYDGNSVTGVATDSTGDIYVIGGTYSIDLPVTANAYANFLPYSSSLYVEEINPKADADSQLIYSSYFPADGLATAAGLSTASIGVDSKGRIHFSTNASHNGFPVTAGAFQRACPLQGKNCAAPAYAVLDPSQSGLSQLVYATFIGGTSSGTNTDDFVSAMAVDKTTGRAYLTGTARTQNFPTTSTAFSQTCANNCPNGDAFLAVLDPTQSGSASLIYSTYLGGNQTSEEGDNAYAIALDGAGKAYITGLAGETNFPTTANALQSTCNGDTFCNSSFISVIDPSQSGASSLVYSTYLFNGSQTGGIALDSNDHVYVAGVPVANSVQTTAGAFQTACADTTAINCGFFVTKLDLSQPAASQLVYSTYVGGTTYSSSGGGYTPNQTGIAVDSNGNVIVAGPTQYTNFPTPNGLVTSCPNGCAVQNDVLFELNSTGSALNYGTYLGGASGSNGYWVATDSNGDGIVVGSTGSSDFPLSTNALQPECAACAGGGRTGFVTEINPAASGATSLLYSSFLGGSGRVQYFQPGPDELAYAIGVDKNGDAYITGDTNSIDFPVVGGLPIADQGVCPGDTSNCPGAAFVAKFDPTKSGSSSLIYSTYYGGNNVTHATSIAVDSLGDAYITGTTKSTTGNFPLVNPYQSSCPACATTPQGVDAYVAELNPAGSALLYSTYFGSVSGNLISEGVASQTAAAAIALDSSGDIFFTGTDSAADLPTTSSAFQPSCPMNTGSPRPCDASFLTELKPSLTNQLVYSTFFGGKTATPPAAAIGEPISASAIGLAVDTKGKAYISGATFESDLPTTTGAFNAGPCASLECGFVAKFDPTLSGTSSLAYSTLLTGAGAQPSFLARIAVDASGDAYVTGGTIAPDYPVQNAYQSSCPDCVNDRSSAVVSELNPTASELLYSTYLGGTTEPYLGVTDFSEIGFGIAVAPSGNILVSGTTVSSDFPTTADALSKCPGSFVGEINPAATPASQLVFSTCLGNINDSAEAGTFGAAIAPFGSQIYIAGGTADPGFPVTANAFQTECKQCTFDSTNAFFGVLAPSVGPPPTPTATPTATSSATSTASATPTATSTSSRTATPTPTATSTATRSATQTPSTTPSTTPSATATPSTTPSATLTVTPTISPTPTISATATPAPGGAVTLIGQGSGGGKPGSTIDLGSFGYSPTGPAAEQVLSTVTVSLSKPSIFNSLTLTASLGGAPIGSATVDAPEIDKSTVFAFTPPLVIPSGEASSLTFAMSAVIAGKQTGLLDLGREVGMASIVGGTGNQHDRGIGNAGYLVFALGLLGLVMTPMPITTRRRSAALAAAMLVMATAIAGCGGSSGGSPPSNSSRQEVVAIDVTESGNQIGVSGLPINLGRITRK